MNKKYPFVVNFFIWCPKQSPSLIYWMKLRCQKTLKRWMHFLWPTGKWPIVIHFFSWSNALNSIKNQFKLMSLVHFSRVTLMKKKFNRGEQIGWSGSKFPNFRKRDKKLNETKINYIDRKRPKVPTKWLKLAQNGLRNGSKWT